MIARRLGVREPTLYRWRDDFLTGGEAALANGSGKKGADPRDRRIAELEAQIEKRDQVIGEYTIVNRILQNFRAVPLNVASRAIITAEFQVETVTPPPRRTSVLRLVGVARRAGAGLRRGSCLAALDLSDGQRAGVGHGARLLLAGAAI